MVPVIFSLKDMGVKERLRRCGFTGLPEGIVASMVNEIQTCFTEETAAAVVVSASAHLSELPVEQRTVEKALQRMAESAWSEPTRSGIILRLVIRVRRTHGSSRGTVFVAR